MPLCHNSCHFNAVSSWKGGWQVDLDRCLDLPGLYSLNEKVAAEREAASQPQASGSNVQASYASPASPAQPNYAREGRQFN